jgi:hypothetical protein
MLLTLTQASQLYGKARSTWHRAIKAGRLSCSFAPDGTRRLDLSELIRVYGEPPHPQHPVALPDQPDVTRNTDALLEVMRAVLEENRAMRQEMVAMRSELAAIKEQRLLPAPPQEGPNEAAGGAQEQGGTLARADDDPHGLRALAARLR